MLYPKASVDIVSGEGDLTYLTDIRKKKKRQKGWWGNSRGTV